MKRDLEHAGLNAGTPSPEAPFRFLTDAEIDFLRANSCIADDWSRVWVKDGFNPKRVFQCRFSGIVRLGNFEGTFTLPGGIVKKAGVRYATLHNVTVGDDSCIENIHNYIANYEIGRHTYIKNVSLIYMDGPSSFGNGVEVSVLNETGGREVPIHERLSAHEAYIMTLYRHRPQLISAMKSIAEDWKRSRTSSAGSIGSDVMMLNVNTVKNVRIGDYAWVEGCDVLENGTVVSNEAAPVHIGNSVSCRDFIISSGSTVDDGANLLRCFVGQSCHLGRGYSATDSLFFSNCHGENGEACAIFAGPYTVTHHKSTLLIAGMFSFMNAGSGSNQSNHMYKLGPIHHGILDRGSKTSSDSYILFPAHVGPFSLVMGRHVSHADTSDLPFSYLIENRNTTYLMPGVNLKSVGTIRDAQKWPKRDKRTDPDRLDHINFNLLSPFTIQKMFNGKHILEELQRVGGPSSDEYSYQSTKIRNSSLVKGLKYYNIGISKFMGNSIIKRLEGLTFENDAQIRERLVPDTGVGSGQWVDLSGLIAPKSEVDRLMSMIENNEITGIRAVSDAFASMAANYYTWEWRWAYDRIEEFYGISPEKITASDICRIVRGWQDAVISLDRMVYEDAKKEFSLSFMTAFGADGTRKEQLQDFGQVRGDFDTNPFVTAVLRHIDTKRALGDELISRLQPLLP
ncbi:MAG: DUF4954 family protein [Bacteroidetes bacterium]|uniref:DUF4954 family protein n=1 Tax=Candidatus Cryptobacteroides merdavium TaxID=2840769 RepID=A0A9D9HCX6_9BACT|nr:DUF4954 family protein [Candidatus Cryptobacteroides merdavium]